jgi:hypothetical protein
MLLSEQLRLGTLPVKAGTMEVVGAASFCAFCPFSTNKRNAGFQHQVMPNLRDSMKHKMR